MQLIETRKLEIAKRVAKLRVQLDAAEDELRKLEITAEMLARLSLNPSVDTTAPRGQSVTHVFGVLGDAEDDAKSPKEIHDALVAAAITTISQDNVRTILSRHRERLEVNDGKYWRKATDAALDKNALEVLFGDDQSSQTENEPTSKIAVGSDAAEEGVEAPTSASDNSYQSWSS